MNTRFPRLAPLGLSFSLLLALLLVPQTRWLVRLQVLTALHLYHPLPCDSYTAAPENDTRLCDIVAAHHADDFQIQYANAALGEGTQALPRLRTLIWRFPNSPLLYANLLRQECRILNFSSSSSASLEGQSATGGSDYKFPAPTPEALKVYNQEAAAGEQADPNNSYFPLMHAFGLFAAHQNAEGLAAVQRASLKPIWNEYLSENIQSQWRLHTEAFGDPSAFMSTSIFAMELLPEYTRLREVARISVYQAVLDEQAGNKEEGYTLREAVRRCGDLMRVQSTTVIGSFVGIAICSISMSRPNGIAPENGGPEQYSQQAAQRRLEAYRAYAIKIGHPEAAQRAQEEEAVRHGAQWLTNPNDSLQNFFTDPIIRLTVWWMANLALLLNIGWLLVLGLAAAGRARAAAVKPGFLPSGAQFARASGLWLLLFLFAMLALGFLSFDASDPRGLVWSAGLGLVGSAGLVTWYVIRGLRRMPALERRATLRTAVLLPVLAGILYGVYCLAEWVAEPLAGLPQGLRVVLEGGEVDTDQTLQAQTLQICAAGSLTVPLLLALIFGITALVRRVSLSQALTVGFQRLALPTACLLVIVYGGTLIGTARQEHRVTDFNHQYVAEGGRYLAAQLRQPWPGPVK